MLRPCSEEPPQLLVDRLLLHLLRQTLSSCRQSVTIKVSQVSLSQATNATFSFIKCTTAIIDIYVCIVIRLNSHLTAPVVHY